MARWSTNSCRGRRCQTSAPSRRTPTMSRPVRGGQLAWAIAFFCGWGFSWTQAFAADELKQPATWSVATADSVRARLDSWFLEEGVEGDGAWKKRREAIWQPLPEETEIDLLVRALDTLALRNDRLAAWLEKVRSASPTVTLADTSWLDASDCPPLIRDNAKLLLGRQLALHQMYDEALGQVESLAPNDVFDPATLLFYRGVAHYRLRQREEGLKDLDQLLENRQLLPRRFSTVADLMAIDLKSLKPDSLDEIARIMDSVRVRLHLGRAGKRVRDEEQEVIDKLDKLIEEAEKQRQQMMAQMAKGQSGGSNQPSSPAEDSYLPEMKAPGDVDAKRLSDVTDWGDLPPKERQEVLQSLGKEFPSHYREVIEEYLRELARQDAAGKR